LKAQRRLEYSHRIPIEGKFGQGKNGYRLNYILPKRADTSFAWINSIFLVMNLLVLQRIFFVLWKRRFVRFRLKFTQSWNRLLAVFISISTCLTIMAVVSAALLSKL
jgi:transposase, IS5 family